MKVYRLALISCLITSLGLTVSCDPGQPGSGAVGFQISGFAAALSQDEFNKLSTEDQYMVANKLLGTMFRGVSMEDFYDLNAGVANLQPKSSTFLSDTRLALGSDLNNAQIRVYDTIIDGLDSEGNPVSANAKYHFDRHRPRQLPLARIKEYPISREMYVHWIAYILANTIMYSPVLEYDSTSMIDVQTVYRNLVIALKAKASVREIIRGNLDALSRWRVSRSPENHALEAYELYLGLFETEDDSLAGGIACQDFYLTDAADDYLLARTDFPNIVPQLILDSSYVTTCSDLYEVIANHSLVIPRAIEVVTNYMLSGRPLADRTAMIASINASNPQTWEDIMTAILFSREYLINTERPRSFEENLMPLLDSMKWSPDENEFNVDDNIFREMTTLNSFLRLDAMGWDTMTYKIGRLPDVPTDGLSFANYHKGIREEFLMREDSYQGNGNGQGSDGLIYDSSGVLKTAVANMTIEEYIDFLFMSALHRKATVVEQTDLIAVFITNNRASTSNGVTTIDVASQTNTDHDRAARITYDYISRLPEFYYFRSVN